MKNIKYIMGLFLLLVCISSCKKETYEFGDITTPSNVTITANVVGQDATNLYGDGSGEVTFTVTASNVLNYKFIYNGEETMSPSGTVTYYFGETGTHKYVVTAVAVGTAGVTSSTSMEVEVLVLYSPPADLLTMLTGDATRTWSMKSDADGHFALYGADGAFWWAATPDEKAGLGIYDDVFTFNVNGDFTHETNGDVLGKTFALDADFGDLGGTRQGWGDTENFPLDSYSATWALSAPGGVETLSFTGLGFMGTYVSTHTYEIVSRSVNEMELRTFDPVTGGWWYYKFIAN